MPTEHELPAPHVDWLPDRRRAILLIHDMQEYFLRFFPAGQSPLLELRENVVRLRERCSALDIPVVFTAQPGDMTERQRGLLKDVWGVGMTARAEDRAIIAELAPRPGDRVLTKWRYSAFHRTELMDTYWETGRDQLIVCGVYAHIGCLTTAVDAFSHDIQPFFVADAVADFSDESHRKALSFATECCAAVTTTDRLIADLEAADERHDHHEVEADMTAAVSR